MNTSLYSWSFILLVYHSWVKPNPFKCKRFFLTSHFVQSSEKLTKLYPGADCSNRNVIDFLQVVLYVIFGHSVQNKKRRWERETSHKKVLGLAIRNNLNVYDHSKIWDDIWGVGSAGSFIWITVQHITSHSPNCHLYRNNADHIHTALS